LPSVGVRASAFNRLDLWMRQISPGAAGGVGRVLTSKRDSIDLVFR